MFDRFKEPEHVRLSYTDWQGNDIEPGTEGYWTDDGEFIPEGDEKAYMREVFGLDRAEEVE